VTSTTRPTLRLDWCSQDAATFAVTRWHYSKRMPKAKLVRVGAWEGDEFVGCVLFGSGATSKLVAAYGLTQTEGCELVRVALRRDHAHPVSRVVAIAMKMLKRANPGLRLVVSFADPDEGHHGGIYQAMGWIYAGKSQASDEYVVRGVRRQGRGLRSSLAKFRAPGDESTTIELARRHLDPGAHTVKGSAKHRYLFPLDAEMRARVESLAKSYPKRA
jgi:hypothetical protein